MHTSWDKLSELFWTAQGLRKGVWKVWRPLEVSMRLFCDILARSLFSFLLFPLHFLGKSLVPDETQENLGSANCIVSCPIVGCVLWTGGFGHRDRPSPKSILVWLSNSELWVRRVRGKGMVKERVFPKQLRGAGSLALWWDGEPASGTGEGGNSTQLGGLFTAIHSQQSAVSFCFLVTLSSAGSFCFSEGG